MSALLAPAPQRTCTQPGCAECGRTAPLADVIDLQARRPRPSLPRRVYWRRRAMVATALVLAVLLGSWGVGRVAAAVAPAPIVAGDTTILQPGDTLWDLALENTPTGGDVRATLHQIQTLNGFTSSTLPAWTVVQLPAR